MIFTNKTQLLTLREVTKILNVHPNTVRNWDRAGILETVRIGPRGDRRFKREVIEKLLSSQV